MLQLTRNDSNSGKLSGIPDFLWNPLSRELYEPRSCFPATDVIKTDAGWDFLIELPGVKASDIKVEVKNAYLEITAAFAAKPGKQQDGTVYRERFSGSLSRRYKLPESTDAQTVSADLSNGVLHVRVLEEPSRKARLIPVKTDQDKVG